MLLPEKQGFFGSSKFKQYFAAFGCQMSAMMTGAVFVWFTPLMSELVSPESHIPMSKEESSWMIAFIEIGELFSPIPTGILVNRWGRKKMLLVSFPLITVSWILLLLTRSVEALYAVRLLQGMAIGVVFTVAPMYLAEIAEPKIRGALCGNFQTMWTLGFLYAYVTGPFMGYVAYGCTCMALGFVFLFTFMWAPESPYFLLMKGRRDEAEKALKRLRAPHEVEAELNSISQSLQMDLKHKSAEYKDLFATKRDRRTLLVVASVCFVKYMSGMPAIANYLSLTLSSTAKGDLKPEYITIVMGIVMLIATIVSAYVSDLLGRRPLVLMSTAGSVLFNLIAAIYYLLEDMKVPNIEDHAWVVYLSLGAYCIINNIGLGPLLQTLQAECFSSRSRGIAGAFTSFLGTIFTFICLKQYQSVADWAGVSTNYFSFAFFSVLGSIVLFIFMKETACKSLGEIQLEEDLPKKEIKSNSIISIT